MKSKFKKRIIAFMLCMVMLLSGSVSTLAEDANAAQANQEASSQEGQNQPAATSEEGSKVEETTPVNQGNTEGTQTGNGPEQTQPEPTKEPETPSTTSTPSNTGNSENTQTPVTPGTPENTQTPVTPGNPENTQNPSTTQNTAKQEPGNPTEQQPAKEEPQKEIFQEAMELKHEIKDANGNVICIVTANIQEKTFEANTSEVSMEVTEVEVGTANEIKALIEKTLAADKILGEYFLYNVNFKVNGEIVEPGKEIQLTFEKSNFKIGDTKKATTFYYNGAHSIAGNIEAEVIDIPQRTELIEALQNAGQSIENIEDNDMSEIILRADGTAEKIHMEGRRSTVYGCYVEEAKPVEDKKPETPAEPDNTNTTPGEEPGKTEDTNKTPEEKPVETLVYEDDDVTITVSAEKEGSIPKNATLRVVPILPNEKETVDQYKEVEEHLNKKAETEEFKVAGFLAYNICFINEKGEEVEPGGDVRVTIDYKQEAIPEEVQNVDSDNLDVTVMHLEEDEKGEVKDVVDMVADPTKEATVETTEAAKVLKAEFVEDNFSYYTVTWTHDEDYYKVKVTAHYGYLDNYSFRRFDTKYDGEKLPEEWLSEKYSGNDYILENYADDVRENGKSYSYVGSKVGSKANYDEGDYATRISLNKETDEEGDVKYYFYYNSPQNGWNKLGNKLGKKGTKEVHIYFLYREKSNEALSTVETIDHTSAGITMKMKDLTKTQQENLLGSYSSTAGYNGITYYNVEQGIVKDTLQNSYPVAEYKKDIRSGGSLESLFGGNEVNHLFYKDTYEQTGYYEYSSFQNYAYLGNSTDFTVYNQIGTPINGKSYFYKRGNFLPYNQISASNFSMNFNEYDENGNQLQQGEPGYGRDLYLANGNINYHFSMSLDADFYQPLGGVVNHKGNSSNMIYEFNGDDDMYVFLDNVLVLDLGGIHDAHSGYIDFATGKIYVELGTDANGDRMYDDTTTIKKMFQKAGVFPDGKGWDLSKVDEYFNGDTFIDYSPHNMKMFYMERGAAASNLHIKFNLQTVPDGQIEVSKNLSNTDKEKYTNEEFKFELYVQEKAKDWTEENPVYKNTYKKVTPSNLEELDITATLKNSDTPLVWNNEGRFILKPQQTATFSGLKAIQKYYVKEVDINSNEYDEVKINSVKVTETSGDGNTITTDHSTNLSEVTTSKEQVYKRPAVGYTNNCSDANSRELKITKAMKQGHTTDDTFSFKIQLTNQNGQLVPYSNGNYYLTDDEGNYYYYNDKGELKNNGKNSKVCGMTDKEGIVKDIEVGYTVAITSIVSGTNFRVDEVNLNTVVYFDPVKTIKDGTYGSSTVEGADGKILFGTGKDAKVTITNSKRINTLNILKVDSDNTNIKLSGAEFKLQKWNQSSKIYEDVIRENKTYTVTTDANGLASFTNLENGKYKVTEKSVPDGYIDNSTSFEVNLPYTEETPKDSSIEVDPNSKPDNSNVYYTIQKTVENEKKSWDIVKRSTSSTEGNIIYLEGAEFELKSTNSDTVYFGKSDTNGKLKWYETAEHKKEVNKENMLPGTYKLTETKAPVGYLVSGEAWQIELGQGGSFISIDGIDNKNKVEDQNSFTFYFDNEPNYSLPSSGGSGIYWYLIGGILLMLAAALILYRSKCKEVLKS